jgi:hypothetical protein
MSSPLKINRGEAENAERKINDFTFTNNDTELHREDTEIHGEKEIFL